MSAPELTTAARFAITDALIEWGVRGDNERLAQAIDALAELGFDGTASALGVVLDVRSGLVPPDAHSVRV